MKLALLGADSESLELVRWAVHKGGHELVSAFDSGPHAGELRSMAPAVRLNEDWESLLLGSGIDVLVVGRGSAGLSSQTGIPDDERRADQLRKLAQAAVPMLVFVPACEAIVGYEIEMIRSDVGGFILPHLPGLDTPAVREFMSVCAPGTTFFGVRVHDHTAPIGTVVQVVFERQQADRSRSAVLAQFTRDASFLKYLAGTIRSVNASGPPVEFARDPLGPRRTKLPSLTNLNVNLGGARRNARWSVGPVVDEEGAAVTLIGECGTATLRMPVSGIWSIDITGDVRRNTSYSYYRHDEFRDALILFPTDTSGVPDSKRPYWLAACRAQEVAEAVDRSLARGRTIELFNEQHTEEQSFKGVMAVGGCLLLMMALGVVFLATMVEGLQLPLRDWPLWQWWPAALLVPVVVFLLLQFLQLAVKREPAAVDAPAEE